MWGLGRGRGVGRGIRQTPTEIGQSSPTNSDVSAPDSSTPPVGIGRGRGRGFTLCVRDERSPSPPSSPSPSQFEDVAEESTLSPIPGSNECPVAFDLVSRCESSTSYQTEASEPVQTGFSKTAVVKKGEKGIKATYTTNFIRLQLEPDHGVFEYHVGFTPDIESLNFRKIAIRQLVAEIGTVRMFDGATLYLPKELAGLVEKRKDFTITHPCNVEEVITVTIRYVKQKDAQDCVQFYNICLNRIMEVLGRVAFKRNFYDARVTHSLPQHKLEIWPGHCFRVDVQEGGLMLLLDSSHKVLRQDTVYDVMKNFKNSGVPDWKKKFEEFILGVVIVTRYNSHTYRIDEVLWDLTPLNTFPRRGTDITYVEYYMTQYNQRIPDVTQPILMSRVKPKRSDRNQDVKNISLVPSLCAMTGLTEEHTQNFQTMKDLALYTRLSPAQRANALDIWLSEVEANENACSILSDWGLSLANTAEMVEGRMISGPSISFSDRLTLKEAGPDFSRESGANCRQPMTLKKWAVLVSQRDVVLCNKMLETYKQVCGQLGIKFMTPKVVTMKQVTVSDISRQLKELTTSIRNEEYAYEYQFILAIFPSQRDDIYGAFKKFLVADKGMPSQVILAKTLRNEKRLRSVMVKVALQINCKLGGAIWSLNMPIKDQVMIIGIDVNHDPTKRNPSVTAMVSTLDNGCTKYYSRVCVQKPHQEIGNSLRTLFNDAIGAFHRANGRFPDRIVVFRDGISDSQLNTAAKFEVEQFMDVINSECPHLGHFTFVVVQKRISERFYSISTGSIQNPTPGSVVDQTITRLQYYDFFLASQLVRQGAVTPTHFVVIHDLGHVKPDLIQKMAYALTFMYFNWPGTIRVPSVCQYAHKLAFLVGQHVKTEPSEIMRFQLYYL